MNNRNLKQRMFLILLMFLIGLPSLFAQEKITVKGTIVDNAGEPMIGVTVQEAGNTANGTLTDMKGIFQITVAKGSSLRFSYIGYKQVERKVTSDKMTITLMEDKKLLDEVVVVGYGVQKKSSLTGAVSQVKSEDMTSRTITSPQQALEGKTSGVQVLSSSSAPGSSPSVRIRGVSSNGGSSPLFIVDGRIAGSVSGIDPNDIESMEVLKDASSAAIYGAQAGNGVVLITTKRGKGNGKITYEYQWTSQSINKVPKVMNSEEYIDYYTAAGMTNLKSIYNFWDGKTNTDWTDVAFENSRMTRHNVTFQRGDENGSLYASMTYLNNDGPIVGKADSYSRITGMLNATYKIKPWLELVTNNQIESYHVRSVAEGSEYSSLLLAALQLDPLTKPTYTVNDMPDDMSAILANSSYGELLNDGNGNYYGVSPFVSENLNPLIMRDRSYSKTHGFNLNGSTSLNFKPIKDFVFTSRLSYRFGSSEAYGYGNDYYANSMAHQNFMTLNASDYSSRYWQWENFFNYNMNFGQHKITTMLGTSYIESRNFGVSGSISGSDTDFGVKKDDPLFYYFAYATNSSTKTVSGGEPSYTRKLSYFGRLNYNYADKYLAQFSLRADAADLSVLPKDKRWGYFPAFSLGWVMSQENWMKDTHKWLSQFKLRFSWGQNGSTANLGGYLYSNVIASTGSYPFNNNLTYLVGYKPSSTGNNKLKWETSEQTDIGFDSRYFNNRLGFTFDYYYKKTKDLIVTGITPSNIVGNSASPINAGQVTNKGFEFELNWQDNIGEFSYGIRTNLSTVKNKVTKIHESLSAINGSSFHTYGAITRFEKGYPAWHFYGYKFTGIDKTTGEPTFQDLDGDGTIGDNDKTDLGKSIPDFTYGITINAAFKGFDFIIFGAGSQGNDIYRCLDRADYMCNKLKDEVDNYWTATNTTGTKPRPGATDMGKYYTSSAEVKDGSYFKIKQIQLGYSLPKSILHYFYMENMRIYCSLEDFFTFTSYKGFDPEVTVGGVDKGDYPTSKKVVLGVSVTF